MSFNPRDYFYIYDSPVPYKQGEDDELLIYPALMRDYLKFHVFARCLTLEKNSVPDVKVISMSYLEYMYSMCDEENQWISLFDGLLRLVLQKPDMKFKPFYDQQGKPFFSIDEHVYNASDFDTIKEIIVEQNMYNLPDEMIQKEVREKMEEARRLRAKMNQMKMASLEEQIISVAINTGWDLEKIYNLSMRKFIKTLHRADHILHAKIYLAASMSGFVEFKDKSFIKHWLAEIDTDSNKDVTVPLEDVQSKINLSSAMKK